MNDTTAAPAGSLIPDGVAAITTIHFALIALVAIGNVGNLSFRLPNLELLDEIGGAALGFVKGIVIGGVKG